MVIGRREKIYGLAALLLAMAAFHGWGWLVFLYPPMLSQMLYRWPPKQRCAMAGIWGVLFSAGFYHWVGAYGVLAWVALSLARGLPWLLYPLPLILLERVLGAGSDPLVSGLRPHALEGRTLVGGPVGLGLVSAALLAGVTGIDWETPAGALAGFPGLLRPLPWLGLAGMATLIGLVGHLLCSGRARPTLLGVTLLALWLGSSQGGAGGRSATRLERGGPGLTIALIQSGVSQAEKWDDQHRIASSDRLMDQTRQAAEAGAQLVVWPETAWPYRGMRRRVTNSRRIGKAARHLKVDILASSIEEVQEDPLPRRWLNSVSLVESSGKFSEHYQKQRLAPFAEYLPLPASWQPFLRRFRPFSSISRYAPGSSSVVFHTAGGYRFAVLICFESMTPRLTSQLASEVDFFVVVTNDAPFDHAAANEAHFRSAVLRAIETGKPVFQAANTGVTGAVDGNGSVLRRSAPGFSGASVQSFVLP